jgi:hypothetical protein
LSKKESRVQSPKSKVSPQSAILSDPDRVVTRLDSYLEAYGSHAALLEMWHGNPGGV